MTLFKHITSLSGLCVAHTWHVYLSQNQTEEDAAKLHDMESKMKVEKERADKLQEELTKLKVRRLVPVWMVLLDIQMPSYVCNTCRVVKQWKWGVLFYKEVVPTILIPCSFASRPLSLLNPGVNNVIKWAAFFTVSSHAQY